MKTKIRKFSTNFLSVFSYAMLIGSFISFGLSAVLGLVSLLFFISDFAPCELHQKQTHIITALNCVLFCFSGISCIALSILTSDYSVVESEKNISCSCKRCKEEQCSNSEKLLHE
jgi:hypothetical protein